jgi:hypothetical protein
MSTAVTVSSASVIAALNASTVRALVRRKKVLIFDQHCSIGLKAVHLIHLGYLEHSSQAETQCMVW